MKLTPEQIEDRLSLIASKYNIISEAVLRDIRELAEDARGEKLELFQTDKVKHLSVWMVKKGVIVLLRHNDYKEAYEIGGVWAETGFVSTSEYPPKPVSEMARRLCLEKAQYLGQYDFKAGLPGGVK